MIVAMKKVNLVVLKDDKERLIKSLQKYGEMMITSTSDEIISTVYEDSMINKTGQSLKLLSKYGKKGLFGNYNVVNYSDFEHKNEESVEMIKKIEESQEIILTLKNDNKEMSEEIKTLTPWIELDLKPTELDTLKMANIHLGYFEGKYLDSFVQVMEEYSNEYKILSKSKFGIATYFICYYEEEKEILDKLRSYNYNDYALAKNDEYISETIEKLNKKISDNEVKIEEETEKLKRYADFSADLEILSDQYLNDKIAKETPCQSTIETVYLEGWVRSDRLDRFEESIKAATEIYDLEYRDPLDDEVVPTYTKNNKFTTPFESITDMFSKPSSKELDPNPAMSVWYWILFGMMMADAGYGLVILVIGLIMKKIMKPVGGTKKLFDVIIFSSIPTMIWGVVFGSYFGFAPSGLGLNLWYWFVPMDEPITMLLISVVVGALHIITGLIIKAIRNIKAKDYLDVLAGQLSWILIMCGIGLYFINSMAGIVTALVGVVLIVLFAGRKHKNIFGKLAFGILGLYDITSYMSDLLSYSRIMALAMSSASVAMVMNQLAGMVSGGVFGTIASILIYMVGHVFNLVLGLLSAYVHDSRLQYIEFYGKFYDGGGVDFTPLTIKQKYIKEIK